MSAVAMPLLTIVAMLFVDWRLALLLVVPIVLSFVLLGSALGSPEGSACQVAMAHSLERMNGTTVEYVHGMPVVKVFNRSDGAFARLEEDAREFVGNVKWATWFNARGMGKLYAPSARRCSSCFRPSSSLLQRPLPTRSSSARRCSPRVCL